MSDLEASNHDKGNCRRRSTAVDLGDVSHRDLKAIDSTSSQPITLSGSDDESYSDTSNDSSYPVPVGDITCWRHAKSPSSFVALTWGWLKANKAQCLAGITVALAQVPEAVSFSFVAGVDPIVGLQSAWIMGICTSLIGGRPGMISGATGAVSVVLPMLVAEYGLGHMFYAIMLAGILQIIFGLCGLGVLVRMVSHSVMTGFCNGLGFIIIVAQFNTFKVRPEDGSTANRRHLTEIGGIFSPFTNDLPWVDPVMGAWMGFQILVTLITYIYFPKITKAIPASLAAIIVSTVFEWALIRPLGFMTNTVGDLAVVKGSFPVPIWIDTTYGYKDVLPPLNGTTLGEIFPTSITVAAIGLLESLLTLELIDEITRTKGNSNREAIGQGVGNFLSGMLGGMGGCTTIGQSLMNVHSGGYTRLSSSVAAIFMLCIILVTYPLINRIPVSALAGVMFVVSYFTIEWKSFWIVFTSCMPKRYRDKYGLSTKVKRSDVLIMLVVVSVTLLLDLAIAVAVGIVIACLVFAWDAGTKLTLDRVESEDGSKVCYTVSGPIFFGSIKLLMDLFPNAATEPKNVTILLHKAELYDWSAMMAIKKLHERFENVGSTVKFQSLTASSHRLMEKGAHLWEGVQIFTEEDVDVGPDPLVDNNRMSNSMNAHL